MTINFNETYLQELYENGSCTDKQHRFQPAVVRKYTKVITFMQASKNVQSLAQYGSLHYEHLKGDLKGFSSVRVNDQYRILFTEETIDGDAIATICNITELSNHYN